MEVSITEPIKTECACGEGSTAQSRQASYYADGQSMQWGVAGDSIIWVNVVNKMFFM